MRGAHLKLPLHRPTLLAPTGIQGRPTHSCSRDLLVHLLLTSVLHDQFQVTVTITGKIASQWIRRQRAPGILALLLLPLRVAPEDRKVHALLPLSELVILRQSIKIGGGEVHGKRRWRRLHPQAMRPLNETAGVDPTSDRRMSVVER